jgi:2-haloacid dehalogenase
MPRVLAFDVNETLLDLAPLDPLFEDAFGDAAARKQWFALMLQVAFVGGLTDRYVDFPTAQRAALEMLAEQTGTRLHAAVADRVAARMRNLPAHADAAPALDRLAAAGLRLTALTNSPADVAREQLAHAGLAERFEAILSADEVRALKPRREAYALVATRCNTPIADIRLVAAHAWDITGALAAGCAAAFVARPGKALSPLGEQPDVTGADLHEIADRIIGLDGR